MRFTKSYTNIDYRRRRPYKLEAELTEFMNMNTKQVEVSFSEQEYKSTTSAQATLGKAVRRWALPIIVKVHNKTLYLIRTDM